MTGSRVAIAWSVLRVLAALAAAPVLYYAIAGCVPLATEIARRPASLAVAGLPLAALTLGGLLLAFALLSRAPGTATWTGVALAVGLLAGVAGLALGFVLPLVLMPENNLGPMIGILFTGPAGVVLGAAVAGWRSYREGRPAER